MPRTMNSWKYSHGVLAVFALICCGEAIAEVSEMAPVGLSIQNVIARAVKDYQAGDYAQSIASFESGLVHYRMLNHIDINCGLRCNEPDISRELGIDMSDLGDLETYGNLIAQANCVKICREEHPFTKSNIERPTAAYVRDFENRVPYDYLQFAYYKTGKIKQACQAAHTYFQVNPYDDQMRENIAFYKGLDEVTDDYFFDLEAKPYIENFVTGAKAYEQRDYEKSIDEIEKALYNYFKALEECKSMCYVSRPLTHFHRFTQAVAARYMPAINCSLHCDKRLRPLIGDQLLDGFVTKCFSYLQISYYQLGKWTMAVPAAASVLLLDPEDEVAKNNFHYYTKNGEEHDLVPNIHYQPRADAVKYQLERNTNEKIYEMMQKTFDYDDESEVEESFEEEEVTFNADLIKEITKQITVTLGERLRGDIG